MKLQKNNWDIITIGELCETPSGGTPRRNRPEYFNGDIPWIKSGELAQGNVTSSEEFISELGLKNSNAKVYPVNTVLVAMYGVTAGLTGILRFEAASNQAVCGLLPNNKFNSEFLFFYLTNKRDYFLHNSIGTAQPNISKTLIRNLKISLPPLHEQTQIAELFQSIETAIEQAEQQEKNLLKLKKTLCNGITSTEPKFGNLLNKKNCTPTNFGGVADCIEQHDKKKKDVSRFIGLENIEPENLKITTWGDIAGGTTFTKKFSKGDVLFGKRRAYLKKVAVADFDGICSGDILVLRAKEKKMLAELLPFYVSAEGFINHAVSTSAGSLSPRTKWRDLSSLEISIPDLKTQEKILEVFQQIETTLSQLQSQKLTLKNLKQKLLNEILG